VRISQTTLARRLKLSTATISKSLRNHPDINPETRARVLDLAAKLDYQVRSDARVDRRKQKNLRFVGVLAYGGIPDTPADYAALKFMAGLSAAAETSHASLVVHHVFGDSRRLLEGEGQPEAMRKGILDGLVLIHRFDGEVVRQLANRMPVVTLVHYVPVARLDHVDADCQGAIAQAAQHLVSLGHRRIGFFGVRKDLSHSLVRYSAYLTAMLQLGLPFVEPVDSGGDSSAAAIDWVVSQTRSGVTGWICGSDHAGYTLWQELSRRGLHVPDDVSLTGFDGGPPPMGMTPLTTLRVPFQEMAAVALSRLVNRIRHPAGPGRQILLECQLVKGHSTGPAKV
jgi:LacI family transcriptional regulator